LSAPLPLGGSMPRRVQPRPIASLQPHPQAGLVPRMAPDAYAAFKADIAARGVQVPIEITSAGVILDGHERRRAAQELEIAELDVLVVEPADEVEHIVLCAIQRRQLSASQRAALAVELDQYRQAKAQAHGRRQANLRNGPEVAGLPPRGKTRELAAGWAGCSPRTIQDASTVHTHNDELFEQVK